MFVAHKHRKGSCLLVHISELVVKVLADLLQDGSRYLWEVDLSKLCLSEVSCKSRFASMSNVLLIDTVSWNCAKAHVWTQACARRHAFTGEHLLDGVGHTSGFVVHREFEALSAY